MVQALIIAVGVVVAFWKDLAALLGRLKPVPSVPSFEPVVSHDLLSCLVDLRKRYANEESAVDAIDDILIPVAVKMLSEKK